MARKEVTVAAHSLKAQVFLTAGSLVFAVSIGCLLFSWQLGFIDWQAALYVLVTAAMSVPYVTIMVLIMMKFGEEQGVHVNLVRSLLAFLVCVPITGVVMFIAADYLGIHQPLVEKDLGSLPYEISLSAVIMGTTGIIAGLIYRLTGPKAG